MGIERFFNSIKNRYNQSWGSSSDIIRNLHPPYQKLKTKYLLIDFNSIVHVVSQGLLSEINKYYVGLQEKKSPSLPEYFPFSWKSLSAKEFKMKLNLKMINTLVIQRVDHHLVSLIHNNFHPLELVYIAIDGVPSKAKMIEQKKRRYMGEIMHLAKGEIVTQDVIYWSKNNISPGTTFMENLIFHLSSDVFKNKLSNVKKYVLSDSNTPGEGEKKIVNYVIQNNISEEITVYSPDADVIILTLLLKYMNNIRGNIYLYRHDQQESAVAGHYVYNLIDVVLLSKIILHHIKAEITTQNIKIDRDNLEERCILDLMMIFTIFGDDFVPKIPSFDVRHDIDIIIEMYLRTLNKCGYIVHPDGKKYQLHMGNLKELLHQFAEEEDKLLVLSYYKNNYLNGKYIINHLLSVGIEPMEMDDFIRDYNFSRDYEYVHQMLIKKNRKIVIQNLERKDRYPLKNFIPLLSQQLSSQWRTLMAGRDTLSPSELVTILEDLIDIDPQNKLPRIKTFHPRVNIKRASHIEGIPYLILHPKIKSIKDSYHRKNVEGKSEEEVKLYQMHQLLDEYQDIFQSRDVIQLGKIENKSIKESKNRYYQSALGEDTNISTLVTEYLNGFYWIFEYYFNHREEYPNWYYDYPIAPLIKEIYRELSTQKIKNWSYNQKQLDTYVMKIPFYTPLEQMMFNTPFDSSYLSSHPEDNNLLLIKDILGEKIKILREFITHPEIKDFYFSIDIIFKQTFRMSGEKLIDCQGIPYLNKCEIVALEDANRISTNKFLNLFRKLFPLEEQKKIYHQYRTILLESRKTKKISFIKHKLRS